MRKALALMALLFLCSTSTAAEPFVLPPNHGLFVVPPGNCTTGIVELGTYKPELDTFWTYSPRKFVGVCQAFSEEMFAGRYRLAVRCVDPAERKLPSEWVRARSGLDYGWPKECPRSCPQ